MGVLATIGLGLAGSFVGGIVAHLFLGLGGGIVFSVAGATLLLYLYRRFVQHRPLTGPRSRRFTERSTSPVPHWDGQFAHG